MHTNAKSLQTIKPWARTLGKKMPVDVLIWLKKPDV